MIDLLAIAPAEFPGMYTRHNLKPDSGNIYPGVKTGCCAMGALLVDRCGLSPTENDGERVRRAIEDNFGASAYAPILSPVNEFEQGFDMGMEGCRSEKAASPHRVHGLAVAAAVRKAFSIKTRES